MNNINKKIAVRVSVAIVMVLLAVLCALPAFAFDEIAEEVIHEQEVKEYIYSNYNLHSGLSPLRYLMDDSRFFPSTTPYLYQLNIALVGNLFDETTFVTFESSDDLCSDVCVYNISDRSFVEIRDVHFKVHHTTQNGYKWVFFDMLNVSGGREQRIRYKLDPTTYELISVEFDGVVDGEGSMYKVGVLSTRADRFVLDYGLDYRFFNAAHYDAISWTQYENALKTGYASGYYDGHDKGYDEGYDEGESTGWDEGYSEGYKDGETTGRFNGYNEGYSQGYELGSNESYTQGYSAGVADGIIEGESKGYTSGYEQGYKEGGELVDLAWDNGYREGNDAGREIGYDLGFKAGYDEGYPVGRDEGYSEGHETGFNDGKLEGYHEAYNHDYYAEALEQALQDIDDGTFGRNLLGNAFSAPFRALSEFTVVSWTTTGGSVIEITLGSVLSAIIGVSLFVWFLKLFAGG